MLPTASTNYGQKKEKHGAGSERQMPIMPTKMQADNIVIVIAIVNNVTAITITDATMMKCWLR